MVYEAELKYETQSPIPFTVANATGIEKGTLLKLTDPMTASIVSATATDYVAGIAASEKIANDGNTKLGVYRGGIFKVTASGSITAGDLCGFTETNQVYSISALQTITTSGSRVAGIALETATDQETFMFELKIMGIGNTA